jgi:hypothetical protein
VARKSAEFLFVKACDKKTQEAVRSKGPGEMVFLDPDGAELHRGVYGDAAGIEKAMDAALGKYSARPISWNVYEAQALESARATGKLAALAFDDGGKDAEALLKSLEDRMVARLQDKFTFIRIPFRKDAEDARTWAVASAPTLLIVSPDKDAGPRAVVERVTGRRTVVQLKAVLQKASRSLEKSPR